METVFVRNEYNYDMYEASKESGLDCTNVPSMAKQSFAEECDINTIVRRFGLTGELPSNVRMPEYGDYTEITDFHGAMNAVAQARESFDEMPWEVRARFDNDPAKFVDFCLDDKNMEEAKKLGLVKASELAAAAAGLPGASAVPVEAPVGPKPTSGT